MRRLAWLAVGVCVPTLGCPSPPPRFGGGAAEGVGESGLADDGGGTVGGADGGQDGAGDGSGNATGGGSTGMADGADGDGMADGGSTDGGVTCPGGTDLGDTCDPFLDDCPACQKCVAYDTGMSTYWDSAVCAPVQPGAAALGEPCDFVSTVENTTLDTCDADGVCWWLDGNAPSGVCVPRCIGSLMGVTTCVDPTLTCAMYGEYYGACVRACNPLGFDCSAGEGCYPLNAELFECLPDNSGGAGHTGDTCNETGDCASGWLCTGPTGIPGCSGDACCDAFCDLGAPTDSCTVTGQSCWPYFMTPPAGLENVGVCGPAM